jgi:hypothetical protein
MEDGLEGTRLNMNYLVEVYGRNPNVVMKEEVVVVQKKGQIQDWLGSCSAWLLIK